MIRIVAANREFQLFGVPDEQVELETSADWDLDRAIDMCRRIDTLIRAQGAANRQPAAVRDGQQIHETEDR